MKIWIVGFQGTNKIDLALKLRNKGLKLGQIFTDAQVEDEDSIWKQYSSQDVRSIFDNNAYIFIKEVVHGDINELYEGLDLAEYESKDVFVLTVEQYLLVDHKHFSKGDLIVWLDGSKAWRVNNKVAYFRSLCEPGEDFSPYMNYIYNQERVESSMMSEFVSSLEQLSVELNNVLYLEKESTEVATSIIYTIFKNPKLKGEFVESLVD